jgi:hypothetical protein
MSQTFRTACHLREYGPHNMNQARSICKRMNNGRRNTHTTGILTRTSFLNNGVALMNKATAAPAPAKMTQERIVILLVYQFDRLRLPPQSPREGTHRLTRFKKATKLGNRNADEGQTYHGRERSKVRLRLYY